MNRPIYPYRYERYFAFFMLLATSLFMIAIGVYMPKIDATLICLLAMAIMSVQVTKALYDFSNIAVYLETDGLRITGGARGHFFSFSWNEIPYAYYRGNSKSLLHLVLSAEPLSEKQVKRIIQKKDRSLRARVCIDAAIVIKLSEIKDISQFKETIQKSILNVEEF